MSFKNGLKFGAVLSPGVTPVPEAFFKALRNGLLVRAFLSDFDWVADGVTAWVGAEGTLAPFLTGGGPMFLSLGALALLRNWFGVFRVAVPGPD